MSNFAQCIHQADVQFKRFADDDVNRETIHEF